jgi:uncharacterized protein YjbI with pentapeptide repeats
VRMRFREALLKGADLREANLREAEDIDEQLADTRSLQGAIMSDGSEHP